MARWNPGLRWRPSIDGRVHPAFWRVAARFREQLALAPGGGAVCVYHRGESVVDLWGGARDRNGRPWREDTMAPSFSTTKGVASTLIHKLVDRGLLDYGDRVAKHWPEFAQAGKGTITLRHVLSHQSGLYHIRQMIDRADRMLDWEYMIHAIERAEPVHPPGEHTGYHGLTYGYLVGEIARRVTGRAFPELVRDEIAAPLGLDGCFVGTPTGELHRAAELIRSPRSPLSPERVLTRPGVRRALRAIGPWLGRAAQASGLQLDFESLLDALAPRGIDRFDFDAEDTLRAAIPAANGLFTARSLARLYAALAGGGQLEGVRLLSRETLERATREQVEPRRRAVIPIDMRWRLGYHAVFTTRGVPPAAFGHFGFGGSGGWADPSRELAVGLIVNGGIGAAFNHLAILRVGAASIAAADARPAAQERAKPERRRAA
jgi:CubicO group peptidase (beta-lactamase class C family)